ncbi:HlyD family efflux transporter periplasmic adaptor subunit [Sulfitobacter geojensis]|uniref:HlyD family efflux transporter periplasmic adaptor subunit n=1 Tax=Sulfitobacter geojensis TaxID=1342299 RepID=UPI00249220C7|nr:HlyD family efflux transporter periplasmic adaptor subunit [Sulfitobacter geojensis]
MIQPDEPLPHLRDDLEIQFILRNGATIAQLYDPLRHRFFELSENSTMILRLWSSGTYAKLMEAAAKVKATFSPDELEVFRRFLLSNYLVKAGRNTAVLYRQRQHASSFRARFSKVLFMRLPLGNPTKTLNFVAPVLMPFLTRGFACLSLLALAVGLYLLSGMPEQIAAQLYTIASLQGAVSLIVAAIVAKIIHETGHAMQAMARGIPVSGWGIIFMLGLPLPYTELSATWRLEHARDRMFIAAGGLLAELILACWMILLFGFLPDGELRTLVFSIATVSILLSLAINLNPLMRFDGYHILSDALSVKNLQARSDAFAKWEMRRRFLGVSDAPPEPVDKAGRRVLISFALAVWMYRFFLYLGIAVILTAVLPLALGAPLALAAVVVFIGYPLMTEMRVWVSKKSQILRSVRAWLTFSILAGLVVLLFVPLSVTYKVPARLGPVESVIIRAPKDAFVERSAEFDPRHVTEGQVLWQLNDPLLSYEIARNEAEMLLMKAQFAQMSSSESALAQAEVLNERADLIEVRLIEIETLRKQLQIKAPISGVLSQDYNLVGDRRWVARGTPLTTVSDFSARRVAAYLPSELRNRIDMNKTIRFFDANREFEQPELQLISISDQVASELEEAEFLHGFGGAILASAADKKSPKGIWHRLEFSPVSDSSVPAVVLTGFVVIRLKPETALGRIFRRILYVVSTEFTS